MPDRFPESSPRDSIRKFDEDSGVLHVLNLNEIPFTPKRVYWILQNVGTIRGNHAHKKLVQVCICLQGAFTFRLISSVGEETVKLESDSPMITIQPNTWRSFEALAPNSILFVLASEEYVESDYIRDFEEFKRVALGIL